ncbi:efflux RND transporter permease subunit [Nisaea nitritireducens]|uniref:efflux RND transporter permease subunit n=1 Tax=Nisaea nitritireducens TaxID=568392 RepID=UPI0018682EF3|nr:efflux RND transporter permease subunit [Nisaea nitritireducens]
MSLPSFCIERPIFTIVLNILVIVCGVIAIEHLPVRQLPRVETPVISVTTSYGKADSALIEQQITTPLEEQLGGIPGSLFMTSTSNDGVSTISINFGQDTDINEAANEVRARVDLAVSALPPDAERPKVAKTDPDAQPIMYLAFENPNMTDVAISDYLDRFVLNGIRAIPGVSRAIKYGARDFVMRIKVSPEKLAAYGLSVTELAAGIQNRNVSAPVGSIDIGPRKYSLKLKSTLDSTSEFMDTVVAKSANRLVRLADVGEAVVDGTDPATLMRINGKPAVGIGVIRSSDSSPMEVARAVKDYQKSLQESLPAGMTGKIVFDRTIFIEKSIEEVFQTIGEAFVLVVLVIILFLGSLRAAAIPVVTIPVSLIGVLAIMAMLGFSINTITLLALVMAIGLVVDDAIVVVENIHGKMKPGVTPKQAARDGMAEITVPVIAMTITLAAVFAPVGIMPGTVGQFFKGFAFTLAAAVGISGFVALTLSPMMCAYLLREGEPNRFQHMTEAAMDKLADGYEVLLRIAIKVRYVMVLVGLGIGGSAWFLYNDLPQELVPTEDQGYLIVFYQGAQGASLEASAAEAEKLEKIIKDSSEMIERVISVVGTPSRNGGIMMVSLKPWDQRPGFSAKDLQAILWPKLSSFPSALAFPIIPQVFGSGASGQPVQIVFRTASGYEELDTLMQKLVGKAAESKAVTTPRSDLRFDTLTFLISLQKDLVAQLGIEESQIAAATGALFGGHNAGRFEYNGRQFDVLVEAENDRRTEPDDVKNVYVESRTGNMIPLASVVTVTSEIGAASLAHYDQLRSATLQAGLAPGVTLGDGLNEILAELRPMLPASTQLAFSGQSYEFFQAQSGVALVFSLAIGVIFLVLAAQFESFRDPVIIMVTVPLAIVGALVTLIAVGSSNNIYSMIGVIMLVGLISKHGILICEFANRLQEVEGLSKVDAAAKAAKQRLRPIIMTASTMVLGVVPLAIATGPGAVGRQSIGWSVIGGLIFGTILTLFVLPPLYAILAKTRRLPDDAS